MSVLSDSDIGKIVAWKHEWAITRSYSYIIWQSVQDAAGNF